MKLDPPEHIASGCLPDWFFTYYPELTATPELMTVPETMLEKLIQLQGTVQQAKRETLAAARQISEETRQLLKLPANITWDENTDRQQFTRELLRNFRIRVTMRDHELYVHVRTPNKPLSQSFKAHPRVVKPELQMQTWEGFYRDIDDALKATNTVIPETLIQTSLHCSDQTQKNQAGQNIDRLLVPAFMLLWQKGYAWYPDLTL